MTPSNDAGSRRGEPANPRPHHRTVLMGQIDPDYADDPAYHYVLSTDELPPWHKRGRDPLVRVKLFAPEGRFTYFVTAYTDDDGHRYLSGYCVSPLGPDCDEHGDAGCAELEDMRTPRLGLPLERDLHFQPRPLSEVLADLRAGRHV
jgi:Protein of unknown function (DUF2958)